ncbi:MAG TPA: MBL fold metallo-hydrolase [Steroidobacteraceae bacterium]
MHILNIGAGSCQLVECFGSDEALIVDCGQMSPGDTDLSSDAIAEYFDLVIGKGDTKVALSHADADHINRIASSMKERIPKSIWMGDEIDTYGEPAATWLNTMADSGVDIVAPPKGFTNHGRPVPELSCGKAETYVLAVNEGASKNSKSLVLLIEYGNFRAIFPGDAEKVTEAAALSAYGALIGETTLLLGSHHGAPPPASNHAAWAAAIAPQIVVFSAGSSHGHPNNEAAAGYREHLFGVKPHPMHTAKDKLTACVKKSSTKAEYVTALNGTIVVETDGEDVSLTCSLSPDCF